MTHTADKDAGRGSRKKGYWPDGRSVIPGLPDLHESVEKDVGVTLTEAEWNSLCRAAGEHTEDVVERIKAEAFRAGQVAACACDECESYRVLPPERGDN